MIPFSLQVIGYQNVQRVLKVAAKTVPFPKPVLFSGPGSSLELCEAISQMGIKKILIVTDEMLVKIGLLDNIKETLKKNGVDFIIFDGVKPDPTYTQIEEGLTVFNKNSCEAVLAVGGGSSIDAAKVISARATNNKSIPKFAGMFRVWKICKPLFAIPTTAGTGSEVTIAAVVSDPVTHKKTSIIDPKLVPLMAALDGELMKGLPPSITATTGMDALTHAIEAFISVNGIVETDNYAIAATKLIIENLPIAVKDGQNVKARQNMALASFYAGLAFTKAGVGYVHAIAHNFGGHYHTPHGLANAIVLPHILDYSKEVAYSKMARLSVESGLADKTKSEPGAAQILIDHIRSMMKEFDIPEKLDALKKSDIPTIATAALEEARFTYAVPKYMDQATCETLIQKMLN